MFKLKNERSDALRKRSGIIKVFQTDVCTTQRDLRHNIVINENPLRKYFKVLLQNYCILIIQRNFPIVFPVCA
jgi:hypothetical protein